MEPDFLIMNYVIKLSHCRGSDVTLRTEVTFDMNTRSNLWLIL